MRLQKYMCSLIPKFETDEKDIIEADIWVDSDDPDEIHNIAYDAGYEVVDCYEINEFLELDDDELEDFEHIEFDEYPFE